MAASKKTTSPSTSEAPPRSADAGAPGLRRAGAAATKPAAGAAATKPAAGAAATKPAAGAAASKPAAGAAAKPTAAPVKKASSAHDRIDGRHGDVPAPRGTTKDGIVYTKDFDVKFLKAQRDLLLTERVSLVGQAVRLEDEANSLIEDGEMGDVQFDDESGEGDTMVVERERDLALSAQARQIVADIDAALVRIANGTYGYSLLSGRPIPRERLEAIPWATELVEEKVGGLGRRH